MITADILKRGYAARLSGIYLQDHQSLRPRFNAVAAFDIISVEFMLPALNKKRWLGTQSNRINIEITATNGINLSRDQGGPHSRMEASAAQLAAAGVALEAGKRYQLTTWMPAQAGYAQSVVGYTFPIILNAIFVPASYYASGSGFNQDADTGYGQVNGNLFSDFVLYRIIGLKSGLTAGEVLKTAEALYNSGRGVDPFKFRYKNNVLDYIDFDKSSLAAGMFGGFISKRKTFYLTLNAGLSKQFHDADLKGMISRSYAGQDKNEQLPYVQSSLIKDYIYPNCQHNLNGYKSASYPNYGLKGAISQSDGSTDLPDSLDGDLNLAGHKIGGLVAGEEVTSTITRSLVKNFYLSFQEYLLCNQTPAGTHSLQWIGQRVNMVNFYAFSCKLSKFKIAPAPGVASIVIDNLQIQTNSIDQDFNTLLDPAVTVKTFVFSTNKIFGALEFRPGLVSLTGRNNLLTGAIPEYPATLAGVDLGQNQLTGFPPAIKGGGAFHVDGNQLSGTATVLSCNDLRLSQYGNSGLTQTGAGNIIIDASANSVNMNWIIAQGAKLTGLILPTTPGRTIAGIRVTNNPGLTNVSFPAWAMFAGAGEFWLYGNALNQVFPLGLIITRTSILIYDNGISEANVNATLDNWLDNQANFASAATVKTLHIGGNNAAPTNTGRATRLDEISQAVESNNWILTVGNGGTGKIMSRIVSFTNADADQLIVTLNNTPNYAAGATVVISNMGNALLNGSYTITSRGTDAAATNNSSGIYYKLSKSGIGTGNTSETGVLTT